MTYNVFDGTLNLTLLLENSYDIVDVLCSMFMTKYQCQVSMFGNN